MAARIIATLVGFGILLALVHACSEPRPVSDSDLNGNYVRRYIDREACVVVYFMYEGAATSLPVYMTTLDVEGCQP